MKKLEVGKTYKLKNGKDVRIICDNREVEGCESLRPYVGLIRDTERNELIAGFNSYGVCLEPFPLMKWSNWDIAMPDKIEGLDWSVIPPWVNWFAADDSGDQYFYQIRPVACSASGWWIMQGGYSMEVPKEFRYKVNCDWKDTLTERPKNEA
jgi:hypothetical protein